MTRPVKKRTYNSTVRREQAARTRRRILDAADELFATDGYARTTIQQIAARAGVVSETVYTVFGSKGRVLTAILDLRLTASADVSSALELPEATAIRDETDQAKQIALFVRFSVITQERIERVYGILRSAAAVDEEMSSIYAEMQTYRARNAKTIAAWIAKNGGLRVTRERAGEIMWGLAAPELAAMLKQQHGWSTNQYAAWLKDTLVRTLLR